MEKVIIEVRINEYASRNRNANVPFSPAEICEEAVQCWRAGANTTLLHHFARRTCRTYRRSGRVQISEHKDLAK